ncbi:MAG: T9SS type A sorting domain-containing protein [Bacteroidales bacterium]|nr:T9SS type A sorting domain-containing protein [Bacteroidales bacterium]
MKARSLILTIFLAWWCLATTAQVIVTDPVFPVSSGPVVITFNADKGDMGLKDYAGVDVYAHTGVITNLSTGPSDWKYVVSGTWSTTVPPPDKVKLTKVSANVYTLTVTPSIREFYGVPAGEQILKLAFVFRNGNASRTGRDVGGADIFYNVSEEAAFELLLSQPDSYTSLVDPGEVIPVLASASVCDSIILYQNGSVLKKVTETTLSHSITAAGSGLFKLVARAWHNNVMKADSAFYFIRTAAVIEPVPAGLKPGVNVTGDNTTALLLYAPYKDNVFVLGDFNDWVYSPEGFMKRSPDGNWYWLEVSGLDPGEEYAFQYMIDETIRVPDPYSTKILDPWNDKYIDDATYPDLKAYPEGLAEGLVSVFRTRPPAYAWKNTGFTTPAPDTLVIYELLVRDFVETHSFRTIRDTLDYFKRLGVNAIEFMPVNEFDGNSSWGYNPAMYFAVDKYYGPADDFRELIDSCHSRGIAVIMDLVLNHAYGNNPLVKMYFNSTTGQPAANNPWFNVEAPHRAFSDWGYDFNHESNATKAFVDSICHYWISEFRVDGFRFDFTKGFTNKLTYDDFSASGVAAYDPSRIAILNRIGSRIRTYKPDAILILEHFAYNSEERELAANDFLLWGNGKWRYQDASVGRSSDLSDASWKLLGFDRPGIVDYMESHDQERIMYLNLNQGLADGGYNIRDFSTAIKRVKLTATFFLTIPGPKMLWQFQELGYDYILGDGYQRLEEKPIRWDYYDVATRNNLYNNFAALIELRKNNPAFSSDNFTLYQSGMIKRLNIQHSVMDVVVLGNFDFFPRTIDPNFTRTGTWYEFFRGTVMDVSASNQNTPISLLQGEYRLYTSKQVNRPSFLSGIERPVEDPGNVELLFEVYPNPFSEKAVIIFTGDNEYQPHTVELFSADGARVRIIAVPAGISEMALEGAGLAPGVYYLKVTSGRLSSVRKVVRLQR